MQSTTFTRRSLAKGALWSVPAIAVASAAPAVAASSMPVTMLWSGFAAPGSTLDNPATQSMDGVALTTRLKPGTAFNAPENWTATGDGQLKLASKRFSLGDVEQIMTLEFTKPVTDVSMTIQNVNRGTDPDRLVRCTSRLAHPLPRRQHRA